MGNTKEARPYFFGQGVLKSIIDRVWVQSTGPTVWLQLATIVHSLCMSLLRQEMSSNETEETAAAITSALRMEPMDESDANFCERSVFVGQQLREALCCLGGASQVPQRS